MLKMDNNDEYIVHIFITGMHMLSKYGHTYREVEKAGFVRIHKYINQNPSDNMDIILAKTISGLSDFVREIGPDLIVVHGDRVETLAGAAVGALNNILVAHIEGGEISGTVDELMRHAVSKLAHVHFVANDIAKARLYQLGEKDETVHVIGSPDVDVMNSHDLPSIEDVKHRYDFSFQEYAVLLFHPVTSELDSLGRHSKIIIDAVIKSRRNFVVIYPNNDPGTNVISEEYGRLLAIARVKLYPSMRFEHFLSLLKNANVIMGNSSAGVREAPHFGVPAINLGSRQRNRVKCDSVLDVEIESEAIARALSLSREIPRISKPLFGNGNSAKRFHSIVGNPLFWEHETQKYFVDRLT